MRIILNIASLFYLSLIRVRWWCYRLKFFKKQAFDTPVVSIGNITVGGTGKTPMVVYFSQLLTKQNIKHAIVSRGYKKTGGGTIIVQDYNKKHVNDPTFAGDEPVMLTYKLKNVPIVVDSNKTRAIRITIERFNPEIILLDDGFQSLYIDKKKDCVLIDNSLSIKEYQLMPKGRLREPLFALKRSDFVFFINKGIINDTIKENILPMLNQQAIPYLDASFKSTLYQHNYTTQSLEKHRGCAGGGSGQKFSYSGGKRVKLTCFAVSGIGKAVSFIDEANKLCYIQDFVNFPDHYNYKKNEKKFNVILDSWEKTMAKKDQQKFGIITTLKDYVKIIQLPSVQLKKHSLYIVDISVVTEDENKVVELILGEG